MGMGDAIGNLSYQQENTEGQGFYRQQSEATARIIDEACKKLVDGAYQRTLSLLEEKRSYIEKLGDKLLEDEQLGHDELVTVLGPRPFQNDSYVSFLENTKEFAAKFGEESVKDKTVKDDLPEAPGHHSEKP